MSPTKLPKPEDCLDVVRALSDAVLAQRRPDGSLDTLASLTACAIIVGSLLSKQAPHIQNEMKAQFDEAVSLCVANVLIRKALTPAIGSSESMQ